MVGKILIALVVIVVAFVIMVATRPAEFHIERSIAVAAPPASVFVQVNDLHAWAAWSPWEKLDPKMERTHAGPPAGPGATYAWKSESGKVGQGRMTIERSAAPAQIVVKLEFIKPFSATNRVTFSIDDTADGAKVTWAMDGRNGFMGKAFALLMNMDKIVGGDFERGLVGLKDVAEAAPKPAAAVAGGTFPQ
jgi:Polyketide cyclase / dehydrase and lipid transport